MTLFKVVSWDTGKTITEVTTLNSAKKHCRAMGHTGEGNGKYFAPVAYVENNAGECVYNPRFKVKAQETGEEMTEQVRHFRLGVDSSNIYQVRFTVFVDGVNCGQLRMTPNEYQKFGLTMLAGARHDPCVDVTVRPVVLNEQEKK